MTPDTNFSLLDYAVFMLYLAAIIGAGFWRRWRSGDAAERYLAGRRMHWSLLGVSLMVSLASSIGFIAAPTASARSGALMFWSLLAIPLAIPVILFVFIPFYHALRLYTAYEYLERRFNLSVRLSASALFILWRIVWMAATLHVAGTVIQVVSGGAFPREVAILLLGIVAALYTAVGGMRAVIWTDLIQFVVLFGGVGAVFIALAQSPQTSLGELWTLSQQTGGGDLFPGATTMPAGSWIDQLRHYLYADFTLPAILIAFTLGKLGNYGVDQVMVQRYLCAPSIREARKGFLFNTLIFALFFALMTLMGVLLATAQHHGFAGIPAKLPPDKIFPFFLAHTMPHGLKSLVIAAIVAAAMSSFDSGVHACITAWANDFWMRLRYRQFNLDQARPNEAQPLPRAIHLIAPVLLGILVILLALYLNRAGDAFTIALKIVNSFIGPLLALFCLALFSRRSNSAGALFSLLLGALLTSAIVLAQPLAAYLHPIFECLKIGFLWTSVAGFLATLLPGLLLAFFLGTPSPDQQQWTFQAVREKGLREN